MHIISVKLHLTNDYEVTENLLFLVMAEAKLLLG